MMALLFGSEAFTLCLKIRTMAELSAAEVKCNGDGKRRDLWGARDAVVELSIMHSYRAEGTLSLFHPMEGRLITLGRPIARRPHVESVAF